VQSRALTGLLFAPFGSCVKQMIDELTDGDGSNRTEYWKMCERAASS
jgi:hypothetical protein